MSKKEKYDFGKVGMKLPYVVPEGFFAEMEACVRKNLEPEPGLRKHLRTASILLLSLTAAAAVVVSVVFIEHGHRPAMPEGFSAVEQAFENLSAEDQEYISSVYQEDIFLNSF